MKGSEGGGTEGTEQRREGTERRREETGGNGEKEGGNRRGRREGEREAEGREARGNAAFFKKKKRRGTQVHILEFFFRRHAFL